MTGSWRRTVLDPIGLVVAGLRLTEVDTGTVGELRRLLADHGVLILRGQPCDDAGFIAFLRQFGDLAFTEGETPVPEHPDLNVVSNVGRTTPPRSVFHVDTSYVRHPPAYTALRAVMIPAHGGETLFTNQYRAFDTLSPRMRTRLAGRTVTHVMTGLELGDDAEASATHPVFRRHPVSGRTALYLSTPERCVSISGLPDREARPLIEYLYAHSTTADNTYRHTWLPGDVVMWDNGCVLHRADHAGVIGDRVLHRGMVTGDADAAR
jgi:taurine dioxygenase